MSTSINSTSTRAFGGTNNSERFSNKRKEDCAQNREGRMESAEKYV